MSSMDLGSVSPIVQKFCPVFALHPKECPCIYVFMLLAHLPALAGYLAGAVLCKGPERRALWWPAVGFTCPHAERSWSIGTDRKDPHLNEYPNNTRSSNACAPSAPGKLQCDPPGERCMTLACQERLSGTPETGPIALRLVLEDKGALTGQPLAELAHEPIYAHVKEVDRGSAQNVLEINYKVLYANNGPYRIGLTGSDVGEHEGDWEHITVRCTKEGELLAVYYSAHRHSDGTWVAAPKVLHDDRTGRIVAFVALNGHGTYPAPATYGRIFGIANDVTSAKGPVWAPMRCAVIARPDASMLEASQQALTVVPDRGTRAYSAAKGGQKRVVQLAWVGSGTTVGGDVSAAAEFVPWLGWRLRWGTQLSPQLQEWFRSAEHPRGSNGFRRIVLPCFR